AGPERIDAGLERLATGERQHRIDAAGRELAGGGADVAVPPIDRGACAQTLDEGDSVLARCRREHLRAAQSRKLQREAADRTRGAVNDESLSWLDVQGVVDSLQRR